MSCIDVAIAAIIRKLIANSLSADVEMVASGPSVIAVAEQEGLVAQTTFWLLPEQQRRCSLQFQSRQHAAATPGCMREMGSDLKHLTSIQTYILICIFK